MRPAAAKTASAALGSGAALLALPPLYLLVLLVAAVRRRRRPAPSGEDRTSFVVLVPAHDEQDGIAATVRSLLATDYPAERLRVVVVADNCTDATAERAHAAGAEVLERTDTTNRGKGQALTWAVERLPPDSAMVVVDADCEVSPNLLHACDAHLGAGAAAVQVDYTVANPEQSRAAALRYAGFALINSVRPAGKDALGLSAGLLGSGMAFSPKALQQVPWTAGGVAEDAEQHARMVACGLSVRFAPEAWVRSPMPLTLRAGASQQMRWETGRATSARTWTPKLLRRAMRERDAAALHQALEPLVPPQSLLLGGNAAIATASWLLGTRGPARLAGASMLAQAGFVLGGLVAVRAPRAVYRALAMAPMLIVWKLWVYARVLAGRGASSWERTERDPASSSRSTASR